ncbi:Metallo-dependent phosphatase [Panus rudis PR-1116 ss-1]|nr:Metallo-dependent phosphatase [Panus rudis PR-1116 ss-1]
MEQSQTEATTLQSATAVVHLEYDINNLPPKPGSGWTRFVCISDTHSHTFPVPEGDVLLHSGDLTHTGKLSQMKVTTDWIRELPHPHKIIIAGNHDLTLDQYNDWYDDNYTAWHRFREDAEAVRELLTGEAAKQAGIVYLEDQEYKFRTKEDGREWTVYGSPWSPYFGGWAFNYERGEHAEKFLALFPKVDILLTHGPPHGIFDSTNDGELAGCEALAAALPKLRPRLHLFGHIHEGHGASIREWPARAEPEHDHNVDSTLDEQTVFVNAANWPMGPKARLSSGQRVEFGKGPFSPVIVDLKD